MKVVVLFCKNKSKKLEMEIDENNDVKNVKMMIEKLTETNEKYSEDYFHIFHRNIILDNDRMVKFYAIEPNDEIYIGKIENYLEIDNEIVDLFVCGYNLSFEYVVIKRNDTISQLKLLISRIIPEYFTVWSFNGIVMQDDLIITDIIIMNRCCKLIIGCGEISRSFSYYLEIHDLYLVSSYTKKQKISFWTLDPYSESEILELKGKLIELKKSIKNNEIIPKLNESLLNIPSPFIRSRYLFCMNTADEIWDIFSDHWANMIGQQCIHRFIRNIFRVELNEELLIYSLIDSNLVNLIYSVLNYITRNKDMLIDNISESMIKLFSKYKQPSVTTWIYKDLHGNIDYIRSEYIDCVNEIAGEIMNEIKTKFITGNEDPLHYKGITYECIDKYYQKICALLIKIEKDRGLHIAEFHLFDSRNSNMKFELFEHHCNVIIMQSIGEILNSIQMHIGSSGVKNESFEYVIKEHIACLLMEYLNVIIGHVYNKTNYYEWNEIDINEIINESIRRMFIRLALNRYDNAKYGSSNINATLSSDYLLEKLLDLLPFDKKFEQIMKNEIDRLILGKNFDNTDEDIVRESVNLFIKSEFSCDTFIEKLSREIFYYLFNNAKKSGLVYSKYYSYPYVFKQNCYVNSNNFKQYIISLLINDSMFQDNVKNMWNLELIQLERRLGNYSKDNRIAELINHFAKPVLNCVTTMKMESYNSFRTIVINALDKCINSLDKIFENPKYFMKFIQPFLLYNQSDSYIDKILHVVSEENFAAIKIKHNNTEISLQIPVCQIKTIIQLKKSISAQTKIPLQQIYMIKYDEDEMSKDEEIINSICDYLVTFVSSMENIEVIKILTNGSFGVVYLCEDNLAKYQFVLKKSRRSDCDLNRDISINLQLQFSNNSTGFHRLYRYQQSLCIGMEYFSRGSLRKMLNEKKHFTERDIAQYSRQILIQIDNMHQDYIIHRDIKPDNVVIDKDNNARLIDFGLSKNVSGLTGKDLLEKLKQYPIGTLGYMAPELIKSETYSEKIDIWSFGIIVYEMRTGKNPWSNMSFLQSAIHVTSSEVINLDLPDDTSEELCQFIYSCLNKNPNERPTAKQLLESRFILRYTN